jgi:streptogramin lyase
VNELEETLGRVLNDTAERYRPGEIAVARERFSQRGRRRRVVRAGAAVALVTACVVGVAFLARPEVISGRPIRPASGSVITVGDAPVSVAIYDGAAWVVNRDDGTVARVDGDTGETEVIDLGEQARPRSITASENALWFTDEFLPGFAPIEPKERTVPTSFPIADAGEQPPEGAVEGELALGDVVIGGGRVWLAAHGVEAFVTTVSLTDLQNDPGSATDVLLGRGETPELAFGSDLLWFSYEGTVAAFEPEGPSTTNSVSVSGAGDMAFGAGSVWTVVDGGAVVRLVPKVRTITEDEGGEVVRDVVGLEIATKVAANAESHAHIAFGEGFVWVVSGSNGDGELVQIDPDKDEVVGRFALSGGPFAVAAGDGWLWVADESGDRIMRIDPQSPGGRSGTP